MSKPVHWQFISNSCGESFSWCPIKALSLALKSHFDATLFKNNLSLCTQAERGWRLARFGSFWHLYINPLFHWRRSWPTKEEGLLCWCYAGERRPEATLWLCSWGDLPCFPAVRGAPSYFSTPSPATFPGSLLLLKYSTFSPKNNVPRMVSYCLCYKELHSGMCSPPKCAYLLQCQLLLWKQKQMFLPISDGFLQEEAWRHSHTGTDIPHQFW